MVSGMLLITMGATIEAAKKGRPLWQGWGRNLRIRIDALGSRAQ